MTDGVAGSPVLIRTAVPADLPRVQQVYRDASLSNPGDAPLLLARPEFLVLTGEGVAAGRTRVAVVPGADLPGADLPGDVAPGDAAGVIVGFATVVDDRDGGPELEDLFVDPAWHRRGIARHLVVDAAGRLRRSGHRELWVTGNGHALAFYLAAGFVEVGQVATELGPGIRMRLDLG